MTTYRLIGILLTIAFTFIMTGTIKGAVSFSIGLHMMLTVWYYIHERIWLRINWLKN